MATSSSNGSWVDCNSREDKYDQASFEAWLEDQASSNSSSYSYVDSDQLGLRSSIFKTNNSISNRSAAAPQLQRATEYTVMLLKETAA